MGARATWSPNQLEFSETVAYITSYYQNHCLPNQTKPTKNLPKPSEMGALATWIPIQLEFSETVAYITSY